MHSHLFSKISVGGKDLKNRLTMAPLYLGYAGEGGTVSSRSGKGKRFEPGVWPQKQDSAN